MLARPAPEAPGAIGNLFLRGLEVQSFHAHRESRIDFDFWSRERGTFRGLNCQGRPHRGKCRAEHVKESLPASCEIENSLCVRWLGGVRRGFEISAFLAICLDLRRCEEFSSAQPLTVMATNVGRN
jgi:hypothetical protein